MLFVLKQNSYHDTAESLAGANENLEEGEVAAQSGDATDEDLENIRGYPCIPDIPDP